MAKLARSLVRLKSLRPRGRHLIILLPPLLVLAGVALAARRSPVAQPVAFNHRKHTKDLGLGCEFCHQYVTTGAHAGLPGARNCGICHQVEQGKSPEAARVTALLGRGDPLRFNKLFRLASHVNYTHRRHVGIAKLECRQCHGAIADSDRPPSRALVRITMNVCLDCHRAKGQSLDCVACHR
ncbi:MAG: cytochrome c3 family protein [Gemmatimonadetes bacterium]|nr:cytochrome c3 family protein [Gemmatimonadota bacterium]